MQNFKALDEIMLPDPRSVAYATHDADVGGFRTLELRDIYARLDRINLLPSVPESVQRAFNRAKHGSLYSWFAYDLHPVADMTAFAALEMALRLRVTEHLGRELSWGEKKLSSLLKYVVNERLVTNDGFERVRQIARARAAERKLIEMITANPDATEIPLSEPSDEEVQYEIDMSSYADRICEAIPYHRNELAHGSSAVYSGSSSRLAMVSEIINQLFPAVSGAQ